MPNQYMSDRIPEYFIAKGLERLILGHYKVAWNILMCGYRRFPDNLEIQFLLIRTFGDKVENSKQSDLIMRGIAMWDAFINSYPNKIFSSLDGYSSADAYVERGRLKSSIGNSGGALEDYKIARQIDPSVPLPIKM